MTVNLLLIIPPPSSLPVLLPLILPQPSLPPLFKSAEQGRANPSCEKVSNHGNFSAINVFLLSFSWWRDRGICVQSTATLLVSCPTVSHKPLCYGWLHMHTQTFHIAPSQKPLKHTREYCAVCLRWFLQRLIMSWLAWLLCTTSCTQL